MGRVAPGRRREEERGEGPVKEGLSGGEHFPRYVEALAPRQPRRGIERVAMPRILHIEDDPANRLLVRKLLQNAGHEVIDAADGLEGVRLACAQRPDLVLVDLNIPGLDGFEVTLRLRGEREGRHEREGGGGSRARGRSHAKSVCRSARPPSTAPWYRRIPR